MSRLRKVLRKAFTPITIMLIPHSNSRPLSLKVPSIGVVLSVALWLIGSSYVVSMAVNTIEYRGMKEKLNYYSGQFVELNATMDALKKTETEFRRLFSLGSREKVLESVPTTDRGSIDMEALRGQIRDTMERVKEIKEYLNKQKDIYLATPRGWPVEGRITSPYGKRENPLHGGRDFHSGVDISIASGSPVRATADGVVSFAGWSGGSGNLVGIEHGFGYATFYAHNTKSAVVVGQFVKRGDVIAYSGSTGSSTGPHSHYEIWKDGRHINPMPFIEGRS
ncbi:MAG TPA: M23 family metallopeptidase [Thermodesulfovibrionales bacterium]|nr:M23 family metallopeptidase [Thermodesulfovibrionales bacterium]